MRSARRRLWLGSVLLALVLLGLGFALAADLARAGHATAAVLVSSFAVMAGLGHAFLAAWIDRTLIEAPGRLAREIEAVLSGGPSAPPATAPPAMRELADRVERLAVRWREAQARAAGALEAALQADAADRRRLEAILRDLAEGLLLCDADGRILMFNDAAAQALGSPLALGLGRSVYDLLPRPLLQYHAALLRRLMENEGGRPKSEPFLLPMLADGRLLLCGLRLLGEPPGSEGLALLLGKAVADDVTRPEASLLQRLERAWRGPLAALIAAAEPLEEELRATGGPRHRLADAVKEESWRLQDALAALTADAGAVLRRQRHLADVAVDDLMALAADRLAGLEPPIRLRAERSGLWAAADAAQLLLLLDSLGARLAPAGGEVCAAARTEGAAVILELSGPGLADAGRWLDAWLAAPVAEAGVALAPAEILARHEGEPWVGPGRALSGEVLHLPLPGPSGDHPAAPLPSLPPRPEFYDFALPAPAVTMGPERRLRELSYVAFDTETTGLDPLGSDAVVQLAAVRVVNGRVLERETFDRLVDPGRPIPPLSTRFHGITDAMVQGRPPLEVVLPQFRQFVGPSVLVAHNAAFDLAFLHQAEEGAGVRLDLPVLDTMLLSALLMEHLDAHSLEAATARLGVSIRGRHTALGDSIATAHLFVRLLDLLELRGITRLGEAMAASGSMLALRRRQAAAFGRSSP